MRTYGYHIVSYFRLHDNLLIVVHFYTTIFKTRSISIQCDHYYFSQIAWTFILPCKAKSHVHFRSTRQLQCFGLVSLVVWPYTCLYLDYLEPGRGRQEVYPPGRPSCLNLRNQDKINNIDRWEYSRRKPFTGSLIIWTLWIDYKLTIFMVKHLITWIPSKSFIASSSSIRRGLKWWKDNIIKLLAIQVFWGILQPHSSGSVPRNEILKIYLL